MIVAALLAGALVVGLLVLSAICFAVAAADEQDEYARDADRVDGRS